MKKIILTLLFLCTISVFAQVEVGTNILTGVADTTRSYQNVDFKLRVIVPKNAIVFNLGYNIPILQNALLKQDFWDKKIGTGIDFSVNFRHHFQNKVIENEKVITKPTLFAIEAGLGVSYLHKSCGFIEFSNTLSNYTDVDKNLCDVKLKYDNVKESFSLTYLDIPVSMEIGKLSQIKISGFLKLGVKASVLISKKVIQEGSYTSSGYYLDWDCPIHGDRGDIPELGYYTNKSLKDPEYNLSPFVLWGSISGGVNFPFSSIEKNRIATWILRVSAKLDYSLTPVSKKLNISELDFEGAKFRLHQSNMLGGNGSRIFSAGISVGLIYCL